MKLSIVVAMAENRVIGVENGLPWHLPEDLKRFKSITMGHPMIMGRLTFESIGKALPGRKTIVLTRDSNWSSSEDVLVCSSIDQALLLAKEEAVRMGVDKVMLVGGANLYEQFLPLCDELFVTEVHTSVDGDAYFPAIEGSQWEEVSREKHVSSMTGGLEYSFVCYLKKVVVE